MKHRGICIVFSQTCFVRKVILVSRFILFVFSLAIFSLGLLIFDQSALAADCSPGRYKSVDKCVRATKGYYVQPGMATQALCPPGTYSDRRGASECTPCPIGHFRSDPGASSLTHCVKAWAGHYVPTTGAAAPLKCPPGTYIKRQGMDRCNLCPPGTYNNFEGNTGCIDAGVGHYAAEAGQATQTPCPANTSRNEKKGSSVADCKTCIETYGSRPGSWTCTRITGPHLYYRFHGVGAKNTRGDNPEKCKKGKNWRTSKQKCVNK